MHVNMYKRLKSSDFSQQHKSTRRKRHFVRAKIKRCYSLRTRAHTRARPRKREIITTEEKKFLVIIININGDKLTKKRAKWLNKLCIFDEFIFF